MINIYFHLISRGRAKPIYKLCYFLYTCKCVDKRKKERNTRAFSLTSPGRVMGVTHDVHVNGPSKSDSKSHRFVAFFYRLFFYESVSNTFL
jgi:hypothetical protein